MHLSLKLYRKHDLELQTKVRVILAFRQRSFFPQMDQSLKLCRKQNVQLQTTVTIPLDFIISHAFTFIEIFYFPTQIRVTV